MTPGNHPPTRAETIRRLGSRSAAVRERAVQDMRFDGPHSAEALLHAYVTGSAAWCTFNRTSWYIWAAVFGILNVWFWVLAEQQPNLILILVLLLVTCQARGWIADGRRAEFQRGMAAALCKFDDIVLLDVLIELYQSNAETELVVAPLCRVLLRLKAPDSVLVTRAHRSCLHVELDRCISYNPHSVELVNAILKALEQVGDTTSIPHVKKLVASAKDRRIQEAARDCLPFLEARHRQATAAHALLRAAAEPASVDLLRAAASGAPEPDQLLRPAVDPLPEELSNSEK